MNMKNMFCKKRLYEIYWKSTYGICRTTIIAAKNEEKALNKFYRQYDIFIPSIIDFKEYKSST